MVAEGNYVAYDVVRLRRADLQGWGLRPYYFFLEGNQLQQLAEVKVHHESDKSVRLRTVAQGETLGNPFGGPRLFMAEKQDDLRSFISLIEGKTRAKALRSTDFDELTITVSNPFLVNDQKVHEHDSQKAGFSR